MQDILRICHITNACSKSITGPAIGSFLCNEPLVYRDRGYAVCVKWRIVKQFLIQQHIDVFSVLSYLHVNTRGLLATQARILTQTGSDVSPCHLGDGDGC